jgi:outer membrane receptor protein involved in Fe transport
MKLARLQTSLALGLVCVGTARAADESGPPAALDEVVVTAQKRAQNAQDVGISISATSGRCRCNSMAIT